MCRPSDTRAENLAEAHHRKMQAYHPSSRVLVAPKNHIASGWTIRIIPWVVGAQGLVHEQHDDCRMYWNFLIYLVLCGTPCVHFSVEALAFMCRLRFSPSLQNRTFDTDDPLPNQVTNAAGQNLSRKSKTAFSRESFASTLLGWSKLLPLKRKLLDEGYSEL